MMNTGMEQQGKERTAMRRMPRIIRNWQCKKNSNQMPVQHSIRA